MRILLVDWNVRLAFPASAFVVYIWSEEKYDTHMLIYIMLSSNILVATNKLLNMKFKLHVITYTATAIALVSYAHKICTAYLIALL